MSYHLKLWWVEQRLTKLIRVLQLGTHLEQSISFPWLESILNDSKRIIPCSVYLRWRIWAIKTICVSASLVLLVKDGC